MQHDPIVIRIEDPTLEEVHAARALVALEKRWISDLWHAFTTGYYHQVMECGTTIDRYMTNFTAKDHVVSELRRAGMGFFAPFVYNLATLYDVKAYVASLWMHVMSRED